MNQNFLIRFICIQWKFIHQPILMNPFEDTFVQESTAEMKRSIEVKDRKIAMMSEKISSHLMLFDSIQKEALCVKRVVDKVQHTVADKENIGKKL